MTSKFLAAAGLGLAALTVACPAFAGATDYEFHAATPTVKVADDQPIAVHLFDKRTGKPVENAVIFRARLDMEPDGMGDMAERVTSEPSTEKGVYRFKGDFTMPGRWALKLQAKVPGESETVSGAVVVTAGDASATHSGHGAR